MNSLKVEYGPAQAFPMTNAASNTNSGVVSASASALPTAATAAAVPESVQKARALSDFCRTALTAGGAPYSELLKLLTGT